MTGMMGETPISFRDMMSGVLMDALLSEPVLLVGPTERDYLTWTRNYLWAAGLGTGALALVLSFFLARQITSPVQRLTAATRSIARGDFSHRVEVKGKDEIGELGEAFNAMGDALAKNEALRRQMVADVAHELGTPVAVIQATLEGVLDGVLPLNREQMESVHQETILLARLVSDLRELSLAEAGELRLDKHPTTIAPLIQRSVEKMSLEAQAKEVSLHAELPPQLPQIEVDEERIGQVMVNLLSNALRYTPPGGEVVVRAGLEDSSRLHISVSDTGSGIPPEDLPRVFERFYRADKSRSRATGGSGIGLAIVRQLVQAHQGTVWAESRLGQGSTFHFTLPLPAPSA